MSVVAVKVFKDGYDISADSQTTTDGRIETGYPHKLFKINGIILGSCGTCEDSFLLKTFANNNRIKSESESKVFDFMSDFYKWKKEKTTEELDITNHFIVGMKKKFFAVYQWFIYQVKEFEAIGSGKDYALSALRLGKSTHEATELACNMDVYCGLPVNTFKIRYE